MGASRQRPTLKTIAELCGMGIPTVSRALNNSSKVSEETKQRVRQVAKEIGYVPDRAGRRLRTGRTDVISLAFLIHRDDQMGQLISQMATALRSTPFQIAIAPVLPQDDPVAAIRQIVEDRLADAVIFNETFVDDPRVSYLLERRFPFATHGRDSQAAAHAYFDFDNEVFARDAVTLLHRRKRTNLALLGPPKDHNYGADTLRGMSQEAARLGVTFHELDGPRSNEGLEELQRAAQRFVANRPECDGFVCSSGRATMAVAAALEEAGRVLGQDVDIVAKGSRTFLNMVRPKILAIEEDVSKAAAFLTRAVVHALEAPDEPPMQMVETPDFSRFLG